MWRTTVALLFKATARLALLHRSKVQSCGGVIKANYYKNATVRSVGGLLLLNQRYGRSDATKRPSLAAPHPGKFIREQNDTGTHESTCPVCNRTIGPVRIELALDELEESHLCLEADPVQRKS